MRKIVFGEWIQSELEKRGLTIADLARLGNTSSSTLWRIVRGERNAGIDSVLAIARGLNLSPFEVFSRVIGQPMGVHYAQEEQVLSIFRRFPESEKLRTIAFMEGVLTLLDKQRDR